MSSQYDTLLDQRVQRLEALTEVASSVLTRYRDVSEQGKMTAADAQAGALSEISAPKYSNSGYFTVYDQGMKMLSHPDPKLAGKDQSELADVNGFKFVKDAVSRAQRTGLARVEYDWNKRSPRR